MNVHSSEAVSTFVNDLGTENATLRTYLRELAEYVSAAALIIDKTDAPITASNFRNAADNALRYLEETHV